MLNLFQFASDDKSLQYLSQIFGPMNGVLPGSDVIGTILGQLFNTFNSIVLTIGALMVVYITVVGVMMTAQEGEFLGKKWNSLWTPIRTVLGIAALVPTSSGYCAIQIVMMWIIVQGVGAADTLWTTAINYTNVAGSMQAQITVPGVGVNQSLSTLFQGVVCDESARSTNPSPFSTIIPIPIGAYYCGPGNPEQSGKAVFCNSSTAFNSKVTDFQYSLGPNGTCGTLTYCNQATACAGVNANSVQCATCTAQVQSLARIIPTMRAIAEQFVNVDFAYQDYVFTSSKPDGEKKPGKDLSWLQSYCNDHQITCAGSSLPKPAIGAPNVSPPIINDLYLPYAFKGAGLGDFIATMSSDYTGGIGKAVMQVIDSQSTSNLTGSLKSAQMAGWALAGGYFYEIAKINNNNLNSAVPPLGMVNGNPDVNTPMSPLFFFRNNYNSAALFVQGSQALAANSSGFGAGSQLTSISGQSGKFSKVTDSFGDINKSLNSTLTGATKSPTNPLVQIQQVGAAFLLIVEISYPVLIAVIILISAFTSATPYVLGTGVGNPGFTILTNLLIYLVPAMYGLFGILLSYGALLGVYVPLIPFIVFTFGVIGWMAAVIEAMVAGPLVALGILSPAGQHELLGKAEPALLMLFSIFLRPSLMIFGLIAANLLAIVSVGLIWSLFSQIWHGFGDLGLLGTIVLLGTFISLTVTAVSKSFSMIHVLPDQVIRWIGGHHAPGSETGQEALQGAKGAAEGAAKGIEGGIGGVRSGMTASQKDATKQNKANAAGGPNVSAGGAEGGSGVAAPEGGGKKEFGRSIGTPRPGGGHGKDVWGKKKK